MPSQNISVYKLKKIFPLLNELSKLSEEKQLIIIPHLNETAFEALYECIHNALQNNKVSSKSRKILKKKLGAHKDKLRYIINNSGNAAAKKKKVIQMGSGLGLILSAILPLLSQFLFKK